MCDIKYSDVKLNVETYCPYIGIEYKDKLSLDPEMLRGLLHVGDESEIIEILVDGFRQILHGTLKQELTKHGIEIET